MEQKNEATLIFTVSYPIKLISKIIIWWTKFVLKNTPYKNSVPSHVAILIDKNRIFEATFFGVKITSFEKWLQNNKVLVYGPSIEISRDELFEKVRMVYGKKYDWLGAICVGFYLLLVRLGIKKEVDCNPMEKNDRFFCSELVGYIFEKEYPNINFSILSPAEILKKVMVDYERQ